MVDKRALIRRVDDVNFAVARLKSGRVGRRIALPMVPDPETGLPYYGVICQQSLVGRRAVLVSGLAALLIGAGPAIINFFYGAGLKVH